METNIFKTINRYSFLIAAFFLIIFEILLVLKGQWGGDFWEHSAVVNELSKHLLHPNNPIIKTNVPANAFFSPYSLLVAIFSRITHLNSIQSLECFAVFNLVFLLLSFYLFCKNVFREGHQFVATLSLLFILFFWGKEPYFWSGFYHVLVLNYVLPYPSTFSISLSFLILSIVAKNQTPKHINTFVVMLLSTVVFITHPTTGMFLYIAIIALNFSFNDYSIKQCIIKSSIVIIPSLLLCLLWPYYNIIALMLGNNSDFNRDSLKLYVSPFQINWPILMIIPSLFVIKKDRIFNFFLIAIIIMTLIYIGGYALKIYGVSRLISNIMMFAHFLIAYTVFSLLKEQRLHGNIYYISLSMAILLSLGINFRPFYYTFISIFKTKNIEYYNRYDFLRTHVSSDDVILSDGNSNLIIPSFNGKVVSYIFPVYWVNDIEERRNEVNSFFNSKTSDSLRQVIMQKYKPDYILINFGETNFNGSTLQWLESNGQIAYKENQMELIKLKR